MSRDYKHADVFNSGTRPLPAWIWLFAAVAISCFAGLIYYLDQYEQAKTAAEMSHSKGADEKGLLGSKSETQAESHGTPDAANTQDAAGEDKSRFDFYKLLPKLRVDVPENEVAPERAQSTTPENAEEPSVTPKSVEQVEKLPEKSIPQYRYILQAGSFKDHREADRLKASLALKGIIANIEPVVLNRSEIWHRVRIGPISSEREMNRIRNRLRGHNIEPVMLKVKT